MMKADMNGEMEKDSFKIMEDGENTQTLRSSAKVYRRRLVLITKRAS